MPFSCFLTCLPFVYLNADKKNSIKLMITLGKKQHVTKKEPVTFCHKVSLRRKKQMFPKNLSQCQEVGIGNKPSPRNRAT